MSQHLRGVFNSHRELVINGVIAICRKNQAPGGGAAAVNNITTIKIAAQIEN
jgi:hypothetical protein